MRHFNIDWMAFVGYLPVWRSLSEAAQRRLAVLKSQEQTPCAAYEPGEVEALTGSRLMSFSGDRKRLRIVREGREFFKAIRAMRRQRLESSPTRQSIEAYAAEHLLAEEQHAMFATDAARRQRAGYGGFYGWAPARPSAAPAADRGWIDAFLEIESAKQASAWEKRRLPEAVGDQFEDGSPYFGQAGVFEQTRRLVEAALTWPQPVPLADLAGAVDAASPEVLGRAVMAAVRYLLLFPRLAADSHEPVIGVWPQIAFLLHRPTPESPRPVEPVEVFHAPYRVEDMAAVLIAAAAEPLRLLANGDGLYRKDVDRIAEALMPLPPWLLAFEDDPLDDEPRHDAAILEERINDAMRECSALGLLDDKTDRSGKRPRYVITEEGTAWLGQDLPGRVRTLAEPWRREPDPDAKKPPRAVSLRAFVDGEFVDYDGDEGFSPWMPDQLRWGGGDARRRVDWRAAFADALADGGDDGEQAAFYRVEDLFGYHARANNPLLGRRAKGSYGPRPKLPQLGWHATDQPDALVCEELWRDALLDVVLEEMLPLGGVEVGWCGAEHGFAVRLHDIGRYMLGEVDEFVIEAAAEGEVIVQPNFEVVFLGPAPAAEAKLGRLAERTGRRMGAMFRLTRASVFAAAAAGVKADDAVGDLEAVSSRPLPDNVRREVAGWFAATSRARLRQAWLIESPDEPTAQRVLAAAGDQGRQLAPVVMEFRGDATARSRLLRKLAKDGVFVR